MRPLRVVTLFLCAAGWAATTAWAQPGDPNELTVPMPLPPLAAPPASQPLWSSAGQAYPGREASGSRPKAGSPKPSATTRQSWPWSAL